MPAVALTDHGVMFGAISFYREAKKAGIKPIIGMEAYLAPRSMKDRDHQRDSRSFHLLLLAENDSGYKNLLKIATASQLEGFYYRPRIDHEFLASHSEGLICTTGCLSGEVPRTLIQGREKQALKLLDWYFEVFGKDHFFFELQEHEIPELPTINKKLIELGGRYDARFVATNDVHYVDPTDAELQDILLCIQTGSVHADPDRMRMTDPSYYLRSPEEMMTLFGEIPGAIENTLRIADRCNVDLDFKGYHLPSFDVPETHNSKTYLRMLCEAGLQKRYGNRSNLPAIKERLDYELEIIHQMGFDNYFLIVWDLCRYASERGIWYNARGSAAGSIVAYSLEITLVDPIEHGLIFERFLNPSRISMPDIDLDFQDDKRHILLEYTAEKYGRDKVAQIITFGTLGARAAIRDVGRVMDIPLPEVDRVAKLVPNIPGKPVTIHEALDDVPEFRQIYEETSYIHELVDTAVHLEGVVRNAGTHAAGVIISDKPIIEYVPLHRPTGSTQEDSPIGALTQFEMQILDSLGLLKVDFLGLSTLTVMARACEMIEKRHGKSLDIHSIPIDDPDTYRLLGDGDVLGVFQVEGVGMRRYLKEMKPRELANVIAMVALYRPGPMDFIPTYIQRMHGKDSVTYRHKKLESIFEETYGIPVYQEQIMRAAMEMGGYTASEADGLRKAISKKKADDLKKHREKFIAGSIALDIPEETAIEVFDDWENFARYGFNKAHAADYGVIAVQTAYLKAHYPLEYMTALLSVFKHDNDKVALYIADCRRLGYEVFPPDVNASGLDFEIEDSGEFGAGIRFGLGAIKNVGDSAVEIILEARQSEGEFTSLEDFAERVDLRQVGKRALECLVRVGALDRLGPRISILESLDRIVAFSGAYHRAEDIGQMSFFGAETGVVEQLDLTPVSSDIPIRRQLSWERELLGVYVSDHPLTPYQDRLSDLISHSSIELQDAEHGQEVRVAGELSHLRPYQTRAGKAMGFATIEDLQGTIELVIFSNTWSRVSPLMEINSILLVEGRVDKERGEPKILVDKITSDLDNEESNPEVPPEAFVDSSPEPEIEAPEPVAEVNDPVPMQVEAGAEELESVVDMPVQSPSEPGVAVSHEALDEAVLPVEAIPSSISPEIISSDPSEIRMITIILESTGDQHRDALRMRRVHGLFTSYPGNDRFAFELYESSRRYLIDFPSHSTGYCADLHAQLVTLLGEGAIRVEPLRIQ